MLVEFSRWAIPVLFLVILFFGWISRVRLYEAFVRGAEQGFSTAVRILPVLVDMMVAIAVFCASGAMDVLAAWLKPLLAPVGFPAEVLPLALLSPLSGGAALGVTAELISTHRPDSFVGRLASVMQGSSDTTFWLQIRCILAAKFLVGPGPVSTQGSNPWWRFQRNLCGPRAMASVLCLFGRRPFDCG